ncbi:MAG: hypothetical protein E7016_04245 [Alphaproteobacteria bacterium]|nr:hypothetical protein [Alphaproteobacteria bacterium]
MTDCSKLSEGLTIARTFDVSSKKDSVVVYSISYQPTTKNRDDAIEFIKNNPDKMLIEHTDCGAKLVEMGFECLNTLGKEDIKMIWVEASRRFINAASGNITAFVENAHKDSVFMSVELPNILQNEKIETINNMDKNLFAKNLVKYDN